MHSKEVIEIVQMHQHFLYLPLYYARHCNFFGLLPKRYEIRFRDSLEKTDQSAYAMLMDRSSKDNANIQFAICDPVTVFNTPIEDDQSPVILAGLITNAAFWAVDRRTHRVTVLRDLSQFDRIIAFNKGTTSFGIARRIFTDAGKTDNIKLVEPGQELVALSQSEIGTVALSPDVLAIHDLVASSKGVFNVDLALGSTPEYSNVLVTALITRQDILQGHSDLVKGLLRAIQRALLAVKFSSPEVVDYARDRFVKEEFLIKRALERANDSHVYPASIEVSQSHWLNAARAACDASGRKFGENEYADAVQIFEKRIKPYSVLAYEVGQDFLERFSNNHLTGLKSIRYIAAVVLSAALLAVAVYWKDGLPWSAIVTAALGCALGSVPLQLFEVEARSRKYWVHFVLWLIFVLFLLAWSFDVIDHGYAIAAILGIMLTDMTYLATSE